MTEKITTPEASEVITPSITKEGLESIELQVRERLNDTDSVESARKLANELLIEAGQEPLAEFETQRVMELMINGDAVERTVVVDPSNFGDTVSSPSEMGIEGFSDEEMSSEVASVEHVERALGETAIESLGEDIDEEKTEETEETQEVSDESAFDELLCSPSWRQIDELNSQLKSRAMSIAHQLDELNGVFNRINYDGGSVATYSNQVTQSVGDIIGMVRGTSIDTDLADSTRALLSQTEVAIDTARRNEKASDEDRYKARKIEEAVEQIASTGRAISDQFEELRMALHPHGRFMQNVEDLMRSSHGYEFTISLLRTMISEATDSLHSVGGQLARMEADLEDVDRLRKM